MKRWLSRISKAINILGIIVLILLIIIGIHEAYHVYVAHKYGDEVYSICLLGYDYTINEWAAWTVKSQSRPEDKWWDYIWYGWLMELTGEYNATD